MARNLFHCADDMPACERPFAEPVRMSGMFTEAPKPDTVRSMLSEPDRRLAHGSALNPNPLGKVSNLEPAKRGRHY